MKPADIADSYDSLAQRWLDPQLALNGISQHGRALKFRAQTPEGGGLALDVGCGCNGRFMRLLAAHGYEVEGLDISAKMIELAKSEFPNATFYHADVCEWCPPKQYDFITAWDSIWHVPLEHSEGVLKKLCGALAPGGVLIWTTGGLDGPEVKQDTTMGQHLFYSVLGIPQTLRAVAEAGCVCRHLEHDQLPEKHVYLIAQKV